MEQRLIAGTDLRVSPLCLGTMLFGSPVEEKEAVKIVHLALEQGVNFIDTANMYEGYTRYVGSPGGVTEEILGKAMGGKREQAVLASKVGMKIGPGTGDEGLSREHIRRECERSLVRLATDWLDLYYMHKPDESTPIAESIETFAELIQAGKVRHWALSNFRARQVREVLQVCDDGGWPRPVAHQPPYSLLNREIEAELLPLCRDENIAVVPYQILQGGLLSGKYGDPAAPPAGTRGSDKPEWIAMLRDEEALRELATLGARAKEVGLSLFDYAIRTTVNTPGITSIILGVRRVQQLELAISALS